MRTGDSWQKYCENVYGKRDSKYIDDCAYLCNTPMLFEWKSFFTFHCSSRHAIRRLSLNHILEEYEYDHVNYVVQTLYNFSQQNIVPWWKCVACSASSTNESFRENPSSSWHEKKVDAVDQST